VWNFLLSFFLGSAIGSSRIAQRVVKPVLKLLAIGVLFAGVIYTYVVFHALSERSQGHHVHTYTNR